MSSTTSMKISKRTTSFSDLSPEIATDILLRLPVTDLINLTSDSKSWYTLIKSPYFISSQILRSTSYDNAVLLVPSVLLSLKDYCEFVSIDGTYRDGFYNIPFRTRSGTLKLVASLHGLLLLTDLERNYSSRDLFLWNPCVRRCRRVDFSSSCFKDVINKFESYCVVGLGFKKASNDYRIVRIVYVPDGRWDDNMAKKVEVYSLRERTWKSLGNFVVPRLVSDNGTYANGRFYWLELQVRGNREEQFVGILSFDFDDELFRLMKLPDEVVSCLGKSASFKLMNFDGSLVVCVFDVDDNRYCIWVMSHVNDETSWTMLFRVSLKKGGQPLNITKKGDLVMNSYTKQSNGRTLISYNLNNMQYKNLGVAKHGSVGNFGWVLHDCYCTVDTSFTASLVMYDEGKSMLKNTK